MSTTKKLADFIVDTVFEDIPKEGIECAKRALLDCIGVTLAGSVTSTAKIVIEMVEGNGGYMNAAVFGAGFRTSSQQAALINGTSAHALDFDDTISSLRGHPSVFLMPVIMALGEELGISGRAALEAYVIGFEIAAQVGMGINDGHYEKGWHPTATLGTIGAAVAGAKILKLNNEQVRTTLGIAASSAAGLRQNFGTMTKPLHAGRAAQNGIIAAVLAQKGFTADQNIIEAKYGFCKMFSRDSQYNLDRITEALGQPFKVTGVNTKPYPACRCTHTALDAVLCMVKEYNILPQDVLEVEVRTHPLNAKVLLYDNPNCGLEGKFSMQYCTARAILDRQINLMDFTDEKVLESNIQDFIKRVKLISEPRLTESKYLASIVRVRLKNGKEYIQRVDFPKGHPEAPMSLEELINKYHNCAIPVMSKESIERSIDMINHFEALKDLHLLANLLMCDQNL